MDGRTRRLGRGWPWWAFGFLLLGLGVFIGYRVIHSPCQPMDPDVPPEVVRDSSGVIENEFVGKTRSEIIALFGRPSLEWTGHYGLPSAEYANQHRPAVTFSYGRPSGTLYVSFERRCGEWICFSSHWVPTGVVID